MKKSILSKDQETLLCKQYLNGSTIQGLSKEWRIAVGTVFKILKKNFVKTRPRRKVKKQNKRKFIMRKKLGGGRSQREELWRVWKVGTVIFKVLERSFFKERNKKGRKKPILR